MFDMMIETLMSRKVMTVNVGRGSVVLLRFGESTTELTSCRAGVLTLIFSDRSEPIILLGLAGGGGGRCSPTTAACVADELAVETGLIGPTAPATVLEVELLDDALE